MQKELVFLSLLCLSSWTIAPIRAQASEANGLRYSVAYFGEFAIHPGLALLVEYPLAPRAGSYAFLAAEAGGYYHARFASGLFVDGQVGYRLRFPFGLFFDGRFGVGYLHTFVGGLAYDEDYDPVPDFGLPSVMPLIAIGVGWELGTPSVRFAPYLRLQAFGQYPFNGSILPHPAILVGCAIAMEK